MTTLYMMMGIKRKTMIWQHQSHSCQSPIYSPPKIYCNEGAFILLIAFAKCNTSVFN